MARFAPVLLLSLLGLLGRLVSAQVQAPVTVSGRTLLVAAADASPGASSAANANSTSSNTTSAVTGLLSSSYLKCQRGQLELPLAISTSDRCSLANIQQ
ncbi:hypothetical protein WJX73_010559 [Symbiochloris irregularis]|uniref:Uncharacterized protein n=1 Tax=Symbiochloris irregularis TaxID=706552 RepID=A0AAW1NKV6_9CHLO